jgi:hypothetical protein
MRLWNGAFGLKCQLSRIQQLAWLCKAYIRLAGKVFPSCEFFACANVHSRPCILSTAILFALTSNCLLFLFFIRFHNLFSYLRCCQMLKRYHEVHFDYSSEFRKAAAVVHAKRESAQLFQGASSSGSATGTGSGSGEDTAVNRLLRERSGISSSLRGVNEVISQAMDAKEHLLGQRGLLGNSGAVLGGFVRSIPTLGKLVEGISSKKLRENAIVAVFCSVLVFFCLWWVLLRG